MKTTSFCINVRSFATWVGCILFAEILGSVCFRSAITTIERRFSLTSTSSAILASGFQIGSLPLIVVVSYFGSRYHRPRTIAIGCMLMCLGFVMMTMPQFVGERYEFVDISSNKSSASKNSPPTMCNESLNDTSCEDVPISSDQTYLLILLGLIMCGMGSTPLQPLGISYIDDNASKHNAAIYFGLVTSIGLVAPALGVIMGAFTLRLWVDVGWIDTSEIKITPSHPGWVGAWWIGILVASVLLFVMSLPMWFFPKKMSVVEKDNHTTDDQKEDDNLYPSQRVAPSLKVESGNLLDAIKRLLTNPRYLLVITISTFEMFRIAGLSTFSIKYYEVIFGKSASESGLLLGAVNLPALVVGTIMGSYAIKRWKLDIIGIARLSLVSLVGSLVITVPIMFIGCDTVETAGLTAPYPESTSESLVLSSHCNTDCGCNQHLYAPVCGPDNITYVTPCHAGCLDFSVGENGNIEKYTHCSCVGDLSSNNSVAIGRCPWSNYCSDLAWVVIALKSVAIWLGGLHATPMLMLMIRSLKPGDKAFGIGMAYFTIRLLAFIPSPIIFGYVIDQTCLHWVKKLCDDSSYCSIYNNTEFRFFFFGLLLSAQILGVATAIVFYLKYAKPDGKKIKMEKLLQATTDKKETRNSIEIMTAAKESILKQDHDDMSESMI